MDAFKYNRLFHVIQGEKECFFALFVIKRPTVAASMNKISLVEILRSKEFTSLVTTSIILCTILLWIFQNKYGSSSTLPVTKLSV
jgi:hypothetical protein